MEIKTFFFNELRTCCYVLWDKNGKCLIIDPGCYSQTERERLVKYITDNNLNPLAVVNTHCHFDHIMGLDYICSYFSIPFWAHPLENDNLRRCATYSSLFGFHIEAPKKDLTPLENGQIMRLLDNPIEVLHTPGHSPGSVCLYVQQDHLLITGDTLFAGSVGRTDLPGGNMDSLMNSLETQLLALPKATAVYPGHGPATLLELEFKQNPYLQHLI